MNFWEKSENVMFLHSLRLSFMPKIRKIYCADLRENLVRQRDRQRERDGPEYTTNSFFEKQEYETIMRTLQMETNHR